MYLVFAFCVTQTFPEAVERCEFSVIEEVRCNYPWRLLPDKHSASVDTGWLLAFQNQIQFHCAPKNAADHGFSATAEVHINPPSIHRGKEKTLILFPLPFPQLWWIRKSCHAWWRRGRRTPRWSSMYGQLLRSSATRNKLPTWTESPSKFAAGDVCIF